MRKDPIESEEKKFFPKRTLLWFSLLGFPLPQRHLPNPTHPSNPSFQAMILVSIPCSLPSSLCFFSTLFSFILFNSVCVYQPHIKHIICLQYIIRQFRAGRKQESLICALSGSLGEMKWHHGQPFQSLMVNVTKVWDEISYGIDMCYVT